MQIMSTAEARKSFSKLLESVAHEPVTVTQNRRHVGVMFSMKDLQALTDDYLAQPLKNDLDSGKLSIAEAIMAQVQINQRMEKARKAIADGKGIEADKAYIDNLRARASTRQNPCAHVKDSQVIDDPNGDNLDRRS